MIVYPLLFSHMSNFYNTEYTVSYSNNAEYRQCIRELCNMTIQMNHADWGIDEETLDEQNYDMTAMCKFLDSIYSITKGHPVFQKLYKYGAATMLSEDPDIGLTVLFSYDYFHLFHPCMCHFIKNPSDCLEDAKCFLVLENKIK